jgi:N-acetylmuramoyl-L-alanine amidase
MNNRPALIALLLAFALAIGGCQKSSTSATSDEGLVSEGQTVSISQLAGHLGLRVSETSETHVTLKNSANTVMLFTYSGGKVYVNGKPIGQIGTVSSTAGQTYVSKLLINQIRTAMETSLATRVQPRKSTGCVVIDPGHGGKDPGATSCLGYHEKDVNLAVAGEVASLLKQRGVRAVLTQSNDRFIELEDRAAISDRYDPELFISIHADSSPSSSTRGFTLYVARSASWSSQQAADAISKSLARTGLESRGIQKADFRVLVLTRNPAVLVELGYLSNSSEARLLRTSSFQTRLAQAIADGISEFLD